MIYKIAETYKVNRHKVEVEGYGPIDAEKETYQYFDIYVDDEDDPINLGESCYTEDNKFPTQEEVERIFKVLYKKPL